MQFTANVNASGGADTAVIWSVTGGGTGTSISDSGLLTVAADEAAASLTITATSVFDTSKSGSKTVTISSGEGLTITFIAYEGADPIEVILPEGVSFDAAGVSIPVAAQKPGDYQFGKWIQEGDDTETAITSDTSFITDTTVVGVYWTIGFTDTDGAEKVRLSNGAFVMYEFDLKGAGVAGTGPGGDITVDDLAAITSITLKQKITEAVYNSMAVRGMRVYGPYAYNANDVVVNQGSWSAGDVLHGDFKYTNDGMVIAKMNGSGAYTADDMLTFNKFHPYMAYNNAQRFGYNNADNGWNEGGTIIEISGAVLPDTWFDVAYPMSGAIPNEDNNQQNLGLTLLRLKTAGPDVLPYGTNYNKVYFAIGPSTENPTDMITYLMKDVKLIIGAITVNGAAPDFDGDGTPDLSFACYEDGNRFTNWRGAPDAEIVTREDGEPDPEWDGPSDDAKADGDGYFHLRLANYKAEPNSGIGSPGINLAGSSFNGQFTKGPLVVNFDANNAMLNVGLTPAQVALLEKAGENLANPLKVTLDGTSTSNADYRFFIGNAPGLGGGWNATSAGGPSAFETLFVADGVSVDISNKSELKYFILQIRNDTHPDTITINSIKIDYTIEPPPPPPPLPAPDEDFVVFSVAGGDTPVINDTVISGNWATMTELNAAVSPIEFPTNAAGEQLVLGSFKSFDIIVKYYLNDGSDGKGAELTISPQKQWGQVNIQGIDHYNLGEDTGANTGGTVNTALDVSSGGRYETIAYAESLTLNFQGRANWQDVDDGDGHTGNLGFIELHEIVFYKD